MNNQDNPKLVDGIQKADKSDFEKSRELVLNSIGEKSQKKKAVLPAIAAKNSVPALEHGNIRNMAEKPSDLLSAKNKKPAIGQGEKIHAKPKRETRSKARIKKDGLQQSSKAPEKGEIADSQEKQKEDFKVTLKRHWPMLKSRFKNTALYFSVAFSVLVLAYLIVSLLVLNWGNKNSVLSYISRKVYIPAVVSADGVISYEKLRSLADEYRGNTDKAVLNRKIASILITNRLLKQSGCRDENELRAKLSENKEVNLASYNRIKKIKQTIDADGNFIKVASKYGDVAQTTVALDNLSSLDFGEMITDIKKDQTSDIITTAKGYYLVHCFERDDTSLSVSYIFSPASTLEQYLSEAVTNYRFWNLAPEKKPATSGS